MARRRRKQEPSLRERVFGPATKTIRVVKPICAPMRAEPLTATLHRYGVVVHDVKIGPGMHPSSIIMGDIQTHWYADVKVSAKAAEWAEYILLRFCAATKRDKLQETHAVAGRLLNAKNRGWANQHGGTMPRSWDASQKIVAPGCKEAGAPTDSKRRRERRR